MKKTILLTALCYSLNMLLVAQNNRIPGNVIPDFGQTFKVENPDIKTNINDEFKVIFDVSKSPEDVSQVNSYIATAARFLNMHTEAGVPLKNLKVALTIHGGAWKDILTNAAYKNRYGTDNPNSKLLEQLTKAGVDIILCGQTASFRKVEPSMTDPNVKLALSAMTALIQYQNMGYAFIKF